MEPVRLFMYLPLPHNDAGLILNSRSNRKNPETTPLEEFPAATKPSGSNSLWDREESEIDSHHVPGGGRGFPGRV